MREKVEPQTWSTSWTRSTVHICFPSLRSLLQLFLWRNWELIDSSIHFSPEIRSTAGHLKAIDCGSENQAWQASITACWNKCCWATGRHEAWTESGVPGSLHWWRWFMGSWAHWRQCFTSSLIIMLQHDTCNHIFKTQPLWTLTEVKIWEPNQDQTLLAHHTNIVLYKYWLCPFSSHYWALHLTLAKKQQQQQLISGWWFEIKLSPCPELGLNNHNLFFPRNH